MPTLFTPETLPLDAPATVTETAHTTPARAIDSLAVTPRPALAAGDISRIIEMAWEDRTPFEDIELEYGLNESAVIALMRREMKASSFRMWRKRMTGRTTKHRAVQQVRMQAKVRGAVPSGAALAQAPWDPPVEGVGETPAERALTESTVASTAATEVAAVTEVAAAPAAAPGVGA